MKILILVLVALTAGSAPAYADPTGGVLTAAIASSILTAGGPLVIGAAAVNAAFATASVIAGALGVGLSVGLQYGVSKLLAPGGPAGQASTVNAPPVKGTIKQASAPQRIVFGRNKIGGIVYLYEVIPPKLYLGLIYSSLPIRDYGRITIEEQEVIFSRTGDIWTPISPPFLTSSGDNRIRVAFQEGTIDQPVNPLAAIARPDLGSDFKLPGLANAVWEFDYGTDFDEFQTLWGQTQIPNPLVETDTGAPIFDPRNPLNRWPDWTDAEDVADAISTWKPTRTAALIQAFWRAAPFGLQAGYGGTNWDEVAKAATFDERVIGTLSDGFIQRGTIDGVVTLDQPPNQVLDSMMTANRAFQVRRSGKGWIEPAQPLEPVFTISDSVIVGGIQFQRDKAKRDRTTKASALFVSPIRQFTEVETPSYVKTAEIASDGEELEASLRFAFTADFQNAERLVKETVEQSLLERSLSLSCSMHCYGLREGHVVRVESTKYPYINGIYQIEEWALDDNRSSIALTLSEFDKSIPISWNPDNDEQAFVDLAEAA